ncbi:MAG: Maf family nucleotide pyrophosphatase [Candidatus Omnitrophota bacterium]
MIYLATGSKARIKLFRVFGLKFKVVPSGIREMHRAINLSYPALVKRNARKKAKAVAERVKNGIIIGADTIVVQDGKIFGKPKNLKAAARMLKQLSSRPQWLYTGVAVIDKDKDKTLVDYEKSKVYMDQLSDSEINAYFSRVSPLEMAGSFDIQGRGAFFIRRIEGCFYNVVGLPLRKLYCLLKRIGVLGMIIIISFGFNGCSREYNIVTGQEEAYLYNYSTEKEVQLGKAIVKQVEKEYELVDDPLIQKRIEDIGKDIAGVCDRKDIDYYFKVLDDDEVNAVSLPGGFVYINKGLVEKIDNDDELAGVIAHEVAHIVARHSIKKLQALQGYSLLMLLGAASPDSGKVLAAADAAFITLLLGYSREDELLADKLGVRYSKLAGYDPEGMVIFLKKLHEINRRKPAGPHSYFRTHPYVSDRVRVTKQELGEKMNFKDYINIEDTLD